MKKPQPKMKIWFFKAFSHAQARKLMIAKFFVSLLAIALSIPYWRMLGLIR